MILWETKNGLLSYGIAVIILSYFSTFIFKCVQVSPSPISLSLLELVALLLFTQELQMTLSKSRRTRKYKIVLVGYMCFHRQSEEFPAEGRRSFGPLISPEARAVPWVCLTTAWL